MIIPPKNEFAPETTMRRFVADPTYVKTLAETARPMITNRYEQQVVWSALLEEYKRLLKEKGIEFKGG